jgi:hypothetical protein
MKENSKEIRFYRRSWFWLLIVGLFIKIIILFPAFIEHNYSTTVYPGIVSFMRIFLGWLPVSIGDILYTAAGLFIFWKIFCFIKRLVQRGFTRQYFKARILSMLLAALVIYIYFNLAWGLNYNRLGIAYQLQLEPKEYSVEDLKMITGVLIQKVNETRRPFRDSIISTPPYAQVFDASDTAYSFLAKHYPWLQYRHQSIKRSLYGSLGNYFGFMGYYNPFTGEAQLNLNIPKFLLPYVTCHEMGHQLGYASESEASFVGYLAAIHSNDSLYHYSTYFDLFSYANRELAMRDSVAAKGNFSHLDNYVKGDFYQLRDYLQSARNPLEPLIRIFYDQYLKANQQEKGMQSYNEVVGWLIAYKKKYGTI